MRPAGATPLGAALAAEIRADGPIGVDRFMAAALGDPLHGYYRRGDPFGAAGDFTTAPEISQVFGEIVGLWLAEAWRQAGSPDPVALVELGPGRGTMMADLLRALQVLPACRGAVRPHLVETSPALRERQRATLGSRHPGLAVTWHDALETVPDGPLLLVANEFFDALPIRQWLWRGRQWRERRIDLDEAGGFRFVAGPCGAPPAPVPPRPAEGAVLETCAPARSIAAAIGARLAAAPGAALIVDYGHALPGCGETLQAVRGHRPAAVIEAPGEADLSAHVDFAALAGALGRAGAAAWGPVAQGQFLIANGAALREQALVRGRGADQATAIRHAVRRLLEPSGMGRLFKVLAATSRLLPRPSGF